MRARKSVARERVATRRGREAWQGPRGARGRRGRRWQRRRDV